LIKRLNVSLLLSLLFSSSAFADLTPEQQLARDKGIILYEQSDWYDSQPLLQVAAEAGDSKAQYYLGEAIRLSKRYTTAEARRWYEAAAEQGHLYAMLRLSSGSDLCRTIGTCHGKSGDQWRKQALKVARERAEEGDTEAMAVLYTRGQGLSWLEQAAESGDSDGQHFLAITYKNGDGWFLIPGNREKAIERWAKASAEAGYVPGMAFYAHYLYEHKRSIEEVAYWLKKTAEAGHLEMLAAYALYTAHLPDGLGYPLNLVEAYGITYLISNMTGGGSPPREARISLPLIAEKMTAEEIQQGIAYAKEWEKTHPPLSYYPPIYGY
jgi:TPR repeat protein